MKIVFLLHNAYAIGGTVRSTLNLAGALAARHEVEIVSVFRSEERPLLGVSRKVRLVPLVDERPDAPTYDGGTPAHGTPLHDRTSRRGPRPPLHRAHGRAAARLPRRDGRGRRRRDPPGAGGLPGPSTARAAICASDRSTCRTTTTSPDVRTAQNEALRHLDAFVTVSAQDAADHRDHLPGLRTRITDIPNAAPRPKAERSDVQAPLVVAAGRLMPVKRYDLLIEAFARVVAVRPEWRLRIYGQGPERASPARRRGRTPPERPRLPHGSRTRRWRPSGPRPPSPP